MSKKTILLLALIVISVVALSFGTVAFADESTGVAAVNPTVSPQGAIYVEDFETINEHGVVTGWSETFEWSDEAHSGSHSYKTKSNEQWLWDVALENGKQYTAVMWIKGDVENTAFKLYNVGFTAAWAWAGETWSDVLSVSTEWKQFTFSFVQPDAGDDANVRLEFLPSDSNSPIYIDDLVIYDNSLIAANLWTNGSMEETNMADIAHMTRDNTEAHTGEWSAKVTGEAWHYGVPSKFVADKSYYISFWAKADAENVTFQYYTDAWHTDAALGTEWKQFSFVHSGVVNSGRIGFNRAAGGTAVYIDDIEVYELPTTDLPSNTLIVNGGFDSELTATVGGLASEDKFEIREGSAGKVAVLDHKAASGAKVYAVELSDSIAYNKKNDFTVKFNVKVEGEGKVSARLVDGETVLAQTASVSLSEGWNDFSAKLEMPRTVADSNAKLQIVLDLQASDAVVSLDNVALQVSDTDAPVHTYEKHDAKAATCTQDGNELYYTCSDEGCNLIFDKDYVEIAAIPVIAAKGHTEVTDVAVAPTCTQKGKTEGKHCSVCNEVLVAQQDIAAKGHTEVVDDAVEATCTETGLTAGKHCSVCNEVLEKQEEIAAKGHTEVTDAAVAPTCTEKGKTEGKHCSVCNEVIVAQQEVAATGHSYGEWTTVKEPTTKEEGLSERVCSSCGGRETKPIAKREVNVVAIVVPVVAGVLVLGGVVVFFIIRKRKISK